MPKYTRLFVFLLLLSVLSSLAFSQRIWLKAELDFFSEPIPSVLIIGEQNLADPTVQALLGVISGPDAPGTVNQDKFKIFSEASSVEKWVAPDVTLQYQDIGVKSVRNNDYFDDRLDMEGMFNCGGETYPSWDCDPSDPSHYYWDISDEQFQSYLDAGFEPFFRIGGEWQNQARHHDYKGPREDEEANWIGAALVVTDRYLHWNGLEQTFQYGDIWTEFPGVEHFWDRSADSFIDFWLDAYVALESAYPEVKWGGVGFAASATADVLAGEGGVALQFLNEAYIRKIKPDWLGFHFFSNDPTTTLDMARSYRDLLNGEGVYAPLDLPWREDQFFAGVELIVDAYGFNDHPNMQDLTVEESDALYNGPMGAAILSSHWISMQYSDVVGAYYYRGNDLGPNESKSGLFHADSDGSYKPISYAFKMWAKLVADRPYLLQAYFEEPGPLFAIVGAASDGNRSVLVSNPTSSELTWTTDDLSLGATYYQVDAINTGLEAYSVSDLIMTIPPYTVQYVELPGVLLHSVDPDPTDPTNPTDPTDSTDPTDPQTPAEPEDIPYEEPSSTVTKGSGGGSGHSSSSYSTDSSYDVEEEVLNGDEVCSDSTFTDIHSHWAEDYISDLFCKGIVTGKSSKLFSPDYYATRAEVLKIALLSSGGDLLDEGQEPFWDVSYTDWFYPYVVSAYLSNFVEGYKDLSFRPDVFVNRAEALAIFMRVFEQEPNGMGSFPFKDVKITDWYVSIVSQAYNEGIVYGFSDQTYRPGQYITRAEISAIAARMIELYR